MDVHDGSCIVCKYHIAQTGILKLIIHILYSIWTGELHDLWEPMVYWYYR